MTLVHGLWPETTGNTAVVEQVGFVAWLGDGALALWGALQQLSARRC